MAQVPRALGRLTSLRELDLENNWLGENMLDDAFPSELACLTRLTRLDLAGNALNQQRLPHVLRHMTSLRSLNLSRVQCPFPPPPPPQWPRLSDCEASSHVLV